MYIPSPFREDDPKTLHDLIQRFSFATLVTSHDGCPFASPLPFLLDAERGPQGTLRSHMARANPQWQGFGEDTEALILFQGPHAYVSPSWYATHPSVPTWNYAVVHAYGTPHLLDEAGTRAVLRDTISQHESDRLQPWTFDSLSNEYVGKMLRALVGFEMEITRLEGKFKLSQNKSAADRAGAVLGLSNLNDPLAQEVAAWMTTAGERP